MKLNLMIRRPVRDWNWRICAWKQTWKQDTPISAVFEMPLSKGLQRLNGTQVVAQSGRSFHRPWEMAEHLFEDLIESILELIYIYVYINLQY